MIYVKTAQSIKEEEFRSKGKLPLSIDEKNFYIKISRPKLPKESGMPNQNMAQLHLLMESRKNKNNLQFAVPWKIVFFLFKYLIVI